MKTELRKVKWNKGKTDNGIEYDYCRIYVEAKVYDRAEKEFGLDVIELELGKSDEHIKLLQYRGKLPLPVEVDWETQVKGKDEVKVVTRFEVLNDKKTV